MTGFLWVDRALYGVLPVASKLALRLLPVSVDLATKAVSLADDGANRIWLDPDGNEGVPYYDARFEVEDAAIAGAVLSNPAVLPSATTLNAEGATVDRTKAEMLEAVRAAYSWSLPDVPEGEDPLAYTLAQNGAPTGIRMFVGIPAGYRPKPSA